MFEPLEVIADRLAFGPASCPVERRHRCTALLAIRQANDLRLVALLGREAPERGFVERADRLARDLVVGELILDRFRAAGVRVLDAEGVELTAGDADPTRKLIRQVLGAVAEFDRCVTVLKLRAARERIRARDGRCEGRKAFGANPAEEQALERILSLRRGNRAHGRTSFSKIAATLNAEGVPTRTGKKWAPAVVFGIVRRVAPKLTKAT